MTGVNVELRAGRIAHLWLTMHEGYDNMIPILCAISIAVFIDLQSRAELLYLCAWKLECLDDLLAQNVVGNWTLFMLLFNAFSSIYFISLNIQSLCNFLASGSTPDVVPILTAEQMGFINTTR